MIAEPGRFQVFALAERLGKTVGEILAMPEDEFTGWQAYFQLREQKPDG